MAFTESQIKQIWDLFELEREELHPSSALRMCLAQTEQDDATYSTTIVSDVQTLLVELTALETEISEAGDQAGLKEIEISGFHRQEWEKGASPMSRPLAQKQEKKTRISRLLKLEDYITTGSAQYARVNSLGAQYGRSYRS